jgi:putative membrane protein
VWLLVLVLGAAYVLALRVLGPRFVEPVERAASRRQMASFALGVLALWVAADWPVHDISEGYLYSVHMVQHLLLTFVAPPLLILGTPAWLMRLVLRPPIVLRAVRKITRPLPALLLFNALVAFTHWPRMVEMTVEYHWAHLAAHVVLVSSALIMWMPVTSPLLELPRLSYPGQILYLFLQSIVPTVPASFLTWADGPIYGVYAAFPRLWGIDVITDQRMAGLVMKIIGGFLLWGIIAVLFFKWHALEESEGVDVLEWRDVDHDLNRTELAR